MMLDSSLISCTTEEQLSDAPSLSTPSMDAAAFEGYEVVNREILVPNEDVGPSVKVNKKPWSPEEDTLLLELIQEHGASGNWPTIAARLKTRSGKQCRERYLNHLKPEVKKGGWTKEEDDIILQLHCKLGNKWSKFAEFLPGRTDNSIKNRWHVLNRLRPVRLLENEAELQSSSGEIDQIHSKLELDLSLFYHNHLAHDHAGSRPSSLVINRGPHAAKTMNYLMGSQSVRNMDSLSYDANHNAGSDRPVSDTKSMSYDELLPNPNPHNSEMDPEFIEMCSFSDGGSVCQPSQQQNMSAMPLSSWHYQQYGMYVPDEPQLYTFPSQHQYLHRAGMYPVGSLDDYYAGYPSMLPQYAAPQGMASNVMHMRSSSMPYPLNPQHKRQRTSFPFQSYQYLSHSTPNLPTMSPRY